jgi:hypothetical protein
MKKIKIMLLSLALFAVVGGALAFKAKFNKTYCTTLSIANPAGGFFCPDAADKVCVQLDNYSTQVILNKPTTTYCYTEKPFGIACDAITTCDFITTLTKDN